MSDAASPSTWTDDELHVRMLLRDAFAWREFQRRFDRLIFRCIHRVVRRSARPMGSEDVREIHATFLLELMSRDMHRLRSFCPERGSQLGSWVGMLATNTARDYLRAMGRQPSHMELVEAEHVSSPERLPSEWVTDRQRLAEIHEVVESFSSRDRDFVRLSFLDELEPEEIAERMQISVKTVYSKKHKIQQRLVRALGGGGEIPTSPT